MLRFLSDEDLDERLIGGLIRRTPELDLVRVREMDLAGEDDPVVLTWAASEGRIVLTHDRQTMPDFAKARVAAGEPMPGVFVVSRYMEIGQAIDEVEILALCSFEGEWEGQVKYLPL